MDGTGYYIGLDGGATRCRLRLRDSRGVVLAEALGGAVNIYVDFEAGVAAAEKLALEIIETAGLPLSAQKQTSFGLGLAGLADERDAARVAEALLGWRRVDAANDAVTACIGGNGGADGGLIIAGTGTAGIARVGGRTTIVGGRGFYLGDDGSGARIGADAARAALRAHDGLEPMCDLFREVLATFDDDAVAMTLWGLTAKPGDYGAFAPKVFEAASNGAQQAVDIIGRAAKAITALARRVVELGAPRIVYVGGVSGPLRPYLPADISALLHAPQYDAIDGAILMMGGEIAS